VVLRRVIDRALEPRLLQRDAGRTDRVDRVVLVEGVARAWQLLTGRPARPQPDRAQPCLGRLRVSTYRGSLSAQSIQTAASRMRRRWRK
jgi:hypothetical protein